MERSRLVATLIFFIMSLGVAFGSLAYFGLIDLDISGWEYLELALAAALFYSAVVGLWICAPWGPVLAALLLVVSSALEVAELFLVAGAWEETGIIGLALLLNALLLHLLRDSRVALSCRLRPSFSRRLGIWAKGIGYLGVLLLTAQIAGWIVAVAVVVALVVIRERRSRRTGDAAPGPGGAPMTDQS
jgi:hypothetical protein